MKGLAIFTVALIAMVIYLLLVLVQRADSLIRLLSGACP